MTPVASSPTLVKARCGPRSTALPVHLSRVRPYSLLSINTYFVSVVGGTLRWQAPELMQGAQTLTTEIDVYAFAISCGEILSMGALPWSFVDDDTVRHLVLSECPFLLYWPLPAFSW